MDEQHSTKSSYLPQAFYQHYHPLNQVYNILGYSGFLNSRGQVWFYNNKTWKKSLRLHEYLFHVTLHLVWQSTHFCHHPSQTVGIWFLTDWPDSQAPPALMETRRRPCHLHCNRKCTQMSVAVYLTLSDRRNISFQSHF